LILPAEGTGRYHVWHLYVIRHTARDQLQQALTHAGITTGLHYPVPLHLQPAYAHLGYSLGDFPVTEQIARQCLSLPIYAELSETQQTCIAQVLQQTLGDL
jgi:dTDP-4-amino-4,6-dideoxygalactose transaminase